MLYFTQDFCKQHQAVLATIDSTAKLDFLKAPIRVADWYETGKLFITLTRLNMEKYLDV